MPTRAQRSKAGRRLAVGSALAFVILGLGAIAFLGTDDDGLETPGHSGVSAEAENGGAERTVTQADAPLPVATSSAPRYLQKGPLVEVAGPDGRSVRCPDGQPLRMNPNPAPPVGVTRVSADELVHEGQGSVAVEAEPLVPRCGENGEIEWYYLSDDPLRR